MNEQTARNVLLVQAIESSDVKRQVLSDDDRVYASRSANELAQWEAADKKSELTPALFLQKRSEQILKKLEERTPAFAKFNAPTNWLIVAGFALPVGAFLAGIFLDRIADPHRVNLLSLPLLMIILWNLTVYTVMVAGSFSRTPRIHRPDQGFLGRMARLSIHSSRKIPQTLTSAVSRFAVDWMLLSAPLTAARAKRVVHLSSACFAVGAVVSLYARGLVSKYQAGWESTWLDADKVHAILTGLFMPASTLFGLPGFSLADVAALQLPQMNPSGGGAAWVHLYAGTLTLLVILPRLLLSSAAAWTERRLSDDFPVDLGQPYFRKLTQKIGSAEPVVLRVVPYSFTLDEVRDRGLTAVAVMVLGEL